MKVEILVGLIAVGVIGAVFIPLAFDPAGIGGVDFIVCDEDEILKYISVNATLDWNCAVDDTTLGGDNSGSFANENTEFRPHLVQGTNVQDPIKDFGGYKIRVMEFLPTLDGMVSWDYLVPEQYEQGDDLEFTLYWFKEDGLADTSVVPSYYEEVTSCGETTVPTTILTVTDLAEFDFMAGEDYLIMANTMWGGTTTADTYEINVKHGSTIFEGSRMVAEPSDAGTSPCNANEDVYKYFWWSLYSPNATEATENITINAVTGGGSPVQSVITSITTNDSEENVGSGSISTGSSDLELHDTGGADGYVGMRFQALTIPQGATIDSAFIQFHVDEISGLSDDPLTVTFRGDDVDDSSALTSTNSDISSRAETTALVNWAIPTWVSTHDEGTAQLTTDLKIIIQEIVDRGGWVSGNDITIMIKAWSGIGERIAESNNGETANAPELTITYTAVPTGTTMLYDDVTFTAIKLSEHFINGTDYFFDQNSINTAIDDTGTWLTSNDAGISIPLSLNTTDYLVLGTANYEGHTGITHDIQTRLMVSGSETDLPMISQESEDSEDRMVHSFARFVQLTNATTLEVESTLNLDGAPRTNENRTSSSIFAINLEKFSQYSAIWIEGEFDIGGGEFGGEVAEITINPMSSDKQTVIISDIGILDAVANVELRVQVDNVDTLPDQTANSYDYNEENDPNDNSRWTLVTVENLSDAIHTIETDISSVDTGADPDANYRTMIAFTLEAEDISAPPSATSCMFLKLMSVAIGEDLSVGISPTFGANKEICVSTSGGADILRTFTWNFNTTEIPFEAEEVGIVKLSRNSTNPNDDYSGKVFGLFGELQWVVTP